MATISKEHYLTYDDVLLKPSYSEINTRASIILSQKFLGRHVALPIISANMDKVTEMAMAKAMWDAGGLGIFHRFTSWENQKEWVFEINDFPKILSVGIRDVSESFQRITEISTLVDAICIDVAHGHSRKVIELIKRVRAELEIPVIAGNVATIDGFEALVRAGADAVKVGIGPGSICTTRTVTGVGVPQLSAIMQIAEYRDSWDWPVKIIADGGIKNSGDIVKALAAGADFVMLGHLLAGHDECPGEIIEGAHGRRYKTYRGQSIFGTNGLRYSPEGVDGFTEYKGPVADTLKRLAGGIRSGMSYVGAKNLDELRNAEFITVSEGTAIETATRVLMEV